MCKTLKNTIVNTHAHDVVMDACKPQNKTKKNREELNIVKDLCDSE